jgi:hypothetical protein
MIKDYKDSLARQLKALCPPKINFHSGALYLCIIYYIAGEKMLDMVH